MRSNKGFTLIELLAVIVILAVIALIATPIIMNVINDSKKGAAKDAMYGYVKAIELASAKAITPTTDAPSGEKFVTVDGNVYEGNTKVLDVTLKGTKPKDKTGVVKLLNGTVTYAELEFDGILVTYNGKEASVGESSSTPTPKSTFDLGEEVYFNPVTNKKCNSGEVNTNDNAKTGCLKWNVITKDDKASNPNIDMMLDHNAVDNTVWSIGGNTDSGEIIAVLQDTITPWNTAVRNTARLITGQEIADIVGDTSWSDDSEGGVMLNSESWLYQNLMMTNPMFPSRGYWTSTVRPIMINETEAWLVDDSANLVRQNAMMGDGYGIRPVITILKSVLA